MAYLATTNSKDIIAALRQRIDASIDANTGSNQQRARAFKQFFLEPNGTEGPGRSAIQSADVNSMVTAVCAQMVISFSTDSVVEYEASSADDEVKAKAESRAVNKIAVEDNGGFAVMLAGVQNALLYRNGYLKTWWDEDINSYIVKHEQIEPQDLPILAESELGITRELASYDKEKQIARIEVTETKKRLRVAAVANDRFFYDPDWNEPTLHDCPISGEVHYKTRDDLVRMGCDEAYVNTLNATVRYGGSESQKKRPGNNRGGEKAITHSMDVIRVYETYAKYSVKAADLRAYLHKCWLADSGEAWLKEPEIVSRVPYAKGTAFPIANQFEGEALAEKLYWIQEGKTELWRQWQDNVRNCSWGRYGAVKGQVDIDDVLNPKAGGPVRIKGPNSLIPIPVIDVGQSIKAALEEMDKARSERGGASVDMVGAEMQLANDTAHGTERVYAAKELLVSYMTRNIAESMIRGMYLNAHAELRAGEGGPINIKIGEQWQEVDPRQWAARTHCNVTVGYSMGERMHMSAVMQSALQFYGTAMERLEGELVTKQGLYKLITDYMGLGLIDNPESYFLDPSSPQAIQAGEQKAASAQAAAEQQADILKGIEELKASVEQYKSDQDTGFKYFNAILAAQVDMAQAETGGVVEVLKARSDAAVARTGNGGAAGKSQNGAGNGNPGGRGNGNRRPSGKPVRANGAGNRSN